MLRSAEAISFVLSRMLILLLYVSSGDCFLFFCYSETKMDKMQLKCTHSISSGFTRLA